MGSAALDFGIILRELATHKVDFIVVGGVGAALQGAPLATFDLDVVHSRHPENVDRLLAALQALEAYYREQPTKRLTPSASALAGPGHHLLMTRVGPLDLLGVVTGGRAYDDLLQHSLDMQLDAKVSIKVLSLAMLITLKEELGRDKDLAALAVLRRSLEEGGKA